MMSKIAVIGVGAALLLGFLFACVVIVFALLSGSQADVGYGAWEDVGADTGVDVGSGDYDTVNTFIELEVPLLVNDIGIISPYFFKGLM